MSTYETQMRTLTALQAENAAMKEQLSEANKERAWVRRKLDIPEDTGFLSGEVTLAGTMHNVCAHAAGYDKYVESYKCDDKQGEIARLTVTCNALKEQVAQLQELNENHAFNAKYFKAASEKSAALVDALERAKNRIQGLSEAIAGQPDACKYIDDALAAFKGEK